MKNTPTLYTLNSLREVIVSGNNVRLGERIVPARPLGYYSLKSRIRIAWIVFTGRADAVVWPTEENEIDCWTDGTPCWCKPEVVQVEPEDSLIKDSK